MARSIRLHRKYGLNPTMPICFWCQKEKGEIALLGAAIKGEALSRLVLDYEPCADCRKIMDQGVVIIEIGPMGDNRPPFNENDPTTTPTGRFAVMKREALPQVMTAEGLSRVGENEIMLVTADVWDYIGLPQPPQE